MKLFDTHCHFDFDEFQDDFEYNLKLAEEQGVSRILIPSVGHSNWSRIQTLAKQTPAYITRWASTLIFSIKILSTICLNLSSIYLTNVLSASQ